MKIINYATLVPIVISGLTLSSNTDQQTFRYNDIVDNNIKIEDKHTLNHLNMSQEGTYTSLLTKIKFKEYLENWNLNTMFISSPNQIIEDQNFLEIVKLGYSAIPFIMEELEEKPSFLVWALNTIFGFKISDDPNTTIIEASRMWLRYLKS